MSADEKADVTDDPNIKAKALDAYQALLASQGDAKAFAFLYQRWHPKLLRFAIRRTGQADLAQDVMQEAALAMAKNIHRLKEPENFSSWAYTIVRYKAADQINRVVKDRRLKDDFKDHPTDHDLAHMDTSLSLKQALAELPETDRLMLTLFYVDGLTGAELAAALGVPLGTIKSRLFKARAALKTIYENEKGDEHV